MQNIETLLLEIIPINTPKTYICQIVQIVANKAIPSAELKSMAILFCTWASIYMTLPPACN